MGLRSGRVDETAQAEEQSVRADWAGRGEDAVTGACTDVAEQTREDEMRASE